MVPVSCKVCTEYIGDFPYEHLYEDPPAPPPCPRCKRVEKLLTTDVRKWIDDVMDVKLEMLRDKIRDGLR